jgi:hypothetical protein
MMMPQSTETKCCSLYPFFRSLDPQRGSDDQTFSVGVRSSDFLPRTSNSRVQESISSQFHRCCCCQTERYQWIDRLDVQGLRADRANPRTGNEGQRFVTSVKGLGSSSRQEDTNGVWLRPSRRSAMRANDRPPRHGVQIASESENAGTSRGPLLPHSNLPPPCAALSLCNRDKNWRWRVRDGECPQLVPFNWFRM